MLRIYLLVTNLKLNQLIILLWNTWLLEGFLLTITIMKLLQVVIN